LHAGEFGVCNLHWPSIDAQPVDGTASSGDIPSQHFSAAQLLSSAGLVVSYLRTLLPPRHLCHPADTQRPCQMRFFNDQDASFLFASSVSVSESGRFVGDACKRD
jgi:hypothetical protein